MHLPYQAARACTTGATPGAKALMSGCIQHFGAGNLGIFNCRSVRGGSTTSLHGEGRAADLAFNANNPESARRGDRCAAFLIAKAHDLGIQAVIWRRKIWSSSRASEGWRNYGGVSPHTDHIHAELTWEGARNLTLSLFVAALGGTSPTTDPVPTEEDDDMFVQLPQGPARADVPLGPGRWQVRLCSDTGDVTVRLAIGNRFKGWNIEDNLVVANGAPVARDVPDGAAFQVSLTKGTSPPLGVSVTRS